MATAPHRPMRPPAGRTVARRAAATIGAVAVAAGLVVGCGLAGGPRDSIEADAVAGTHDDPAPTGAPAPTTTTVPTTTTAVPTTAPAPMVPVVERIETDEPVVFLTIDDGATRDPAMIELLAQRGVPWTSFLTVELADADPGFWRRSQQLGGTIQAHTIDHPDLRTLPPAELRRQLCEPLDRFEADYGTRPRLLRPPFGRFDDDVRRVAAECGYDALVMWTGVVDDGVLDLQADRLRSGDILLMHYRDEWRADLDAALGAAVLSGMRLELLEDHLPPTS